MQGVFWCVILRVTPYVLLYVSTRTVFWVFYSGMRVTYVSYRQVLHADFSHVPAAATYTICVGRSHAACSRLFVLVAPRQTAICHCSVGPSCVVFCRRCERARWTGESVDELRTSLNSCASLRHLKIARAYSQSKASYTYSSARKPHSSLAPP